MDWSKECFWSKTVEIYLSDETQRHKLLSVDDQLAVHRDAALTKDKPAQLSITNLGFEGLMARLRAYKMCVSNGFM